MEDPKITSLLGLFPPAPLTYVLGFAALLDTSAFGVILDPRVVLIPTMSWQDMQVFAFELRERALRQGEWLAAVSIARIQDPYKDPAFHDMMRMCDNAFYVLSSSEAEVLKVRGRHPSTSAPVIRRAESRFDPWIGKGDVLRF